MMLAMSSQALHEAELWMVRNMTWLFQGKEALLKMFANIAIDSESNLGFATKAAGSKTTWTPGHIGTLVEGRIFNSPCNCS